jgi:glycosyltransferase involved in cell wall biosynthesis
MSLEQQTLPQGVERRTADTGRVVGSTVIGVTQVSIIIPAFNEARMIGKCLDSLTRLDFPRDQFEVILVDNGSQDATVQIAESFADRLNLTILKKHAVKISALRNLGANSARGDILAFLDADCLPPATWLTDILALASTDGSGVVGAHYVLPEDSTWVGRTWHVYQEAPKSGDVSHVPGGDLVMRREDFLRVRGFDESIQTNEDYELCDRVRKSGMPVRAFPKIGVVHLGTAQSLKVFYRKQRWHGTHVVKVFLRDVLHSDNKKAVLFAVYTLICVVAFVATSAMVLFRFSRVTPIIALGALLLPPVLMALPKVWAKKKFGDFVPLAMLYLTYGLARARALLNAAKG